MKINYYFVILTTFREEESRAGTRLVPLPGHFARFLATLEMTSSSCFCWQGSCKRAKCKPVCDFSAPTRSISVGCDGENFSSPEESRLVAHQSKLALLSIDNAKVMNRKFAFRLNAKFVKVRASADAV